MNQRLRTISILKCVLLVFVFNANSLTIRGGETRWQLFNQCSKAMLQTYLGHVNTRGHSSRLCLITLVDLRLCSPSSNFHRHH
ncbi:hypothetical protein DICVIV_13113 [Dictyocaulus viviparus]|uniref:Secreted protein n=1 Tax=Dictyocaulus viviparus TaxID=29172 RepID=A0A0D8X8M6_DICVI|nr:hypothetical protein DICVIV_13113 [Dictyocaulus viviparus]